MVQKSATENDALLLLERETPAVKLWIFILLLLTLPLPNKSICLISGFEVSKKSVHERSNGEFGLSDWPQT